MEPITAADFHDIAKPESPRLSPDGERVAFVRKVPEDEESYTATVHLVPTDGSDGPVPFTVEEGVDSDPRFSPSGDRLAFVSTRGTDDDRPQLWVMPTDGGEARRVTAVPGGVQGIRWSPDGTRIAFVQTVTAAEREEGLDVDVSGEEEYERETPDPRVIDRTVYRTARRYFDGGRSHVYVVDLASETVERVTDGDDDFTAPDWGDETTLYYAANDVGEDPDDSMAYDIVAYDTDADEHERLHRTTGFTAGLAATADGRVAFAFTEEERASLQQTELKVYDREADAVAHLTADLDRTLGYESNPQWDPQEDLVFFTTPDEGKTSVWAAPGDASDPPERVARPGTVSGVDVGTDRLAFAASEWDHPGDVLVRARETDDTADGAADATGDGDAETPEPTRLTELNADLLAEREVREPETLRVESEQGAVEGWVLTPPGFDAEETYPMVVEVHGGPHAMWSTSGTMWHEFQTLAARGYVVFWSNPRGSTGYGEEYAQAIERDWGEVTLTDVMAGVEEVAGRAYVDEDQVFLTGGSFGGFMTAWTVGETDYFRAAVAQRGVYDLTGLWGTTDWAYKLVEGDFGTTPWEEPEFLWEQSPAATAHRVTTPTLVLHSDDDFRTPASMAELWFRILRKHGVDTRFVRYPREGHELSRSGEPGHVVDRIERIARWFDGYSEYHDVPRALERGDDGLSTTGDEDESDDGDESHGDDGSE